MARTRTTNMTVMRCAKTKSPTLREVWVAKTFCEALPTNIVATNTFGKIVALVTKFSAGEAAGPANSGRNCNKCRPRRSPPFVTDEDNTEENATEKRVRDSQNDPRIYLWYKCLSFRLFQFFSVQEKWALFYSIFLLFFVLVVWV